MSRKSLALLFASVALVAACGEDRPESLELAAAPESPFCAARLADFELTSQSGRSVRLADLLGRPAVVDFIFTTCTGPCPRVSGQMRRVQDLLGAREVRLVTFSVDPETDTPAVLAEYAQRLGADRERWWFLTGAAEQIDAVLASAWLPSLSKNPAAELGMQVTHSTRLIVLDAEGVVRGYYDGESERGSAAAVLRAVWLAEHPGQ